MGKRKVEQHATKINVNFTKCDAGWIDFNVQTEDGISVEVCASHIFDPFPQMIRWLEAILNGIPECAFIIDEEGAEKVFRVRCNGADAQHFILSDDVGTEFIHAVVNPMQLVSNFYMALREFAQSSKYRHCEWQVETLGERLMRCYRVRNKSLSQIVDDLVTCDAGELRAIFWYIALSYSVHSIQAKNETDDFKECIEYFLDPDKIETQKNIIRIPDYYPVPEEYTLWNILKKKEFIDDCLNDHINSWHGCRLAELCSHFIEEKLQNYNPKLL